ncbi:hypothetical protein [Streptomyces sp. NPDC053048]|uniref:hypothetical protein n=1 Tax=Streptomyces sp. NPDC053048 TaxID=3365694 RepID=UPI0037D23CCB
MTDIDIVNSVTPDFRPLLDVDQLSRWTLDRQREHNTDTAHYEAALAAFQTALRKQRVDGDGRWSPVLRARKVEKHLKALVKASRQASAAAESLRTTYATHVALVEALPGERAKKDAEKAAKKAHRRQAVGALAAKSLHKTTLAMAPHTPEDGQDGEAPGQPQPAAPPGGELRGINDLFGGGRKGA